MSTPFRIFASSDWHGDWSTLGVPRFAEIREAAHAWADAAIAEDADAAVFLGDLCNPDRGTPVFRCVHLAIEVALKLRARGVSSIWLAGNHDTIEDTSGDTSLTPLRALELLEPRDLRVGSEGRIFVAEMPSVIEIESRTVEWVAQDETRRRKVSFLCLPFTSPSHSYDAAAAVEDLSRGVDRGDLVVLSHLAVPGVEPGEETTDMARGREVVLPVDLALERSSLVLQGHYHRQQRTPEGIWIAGSLARLTFAPGIAEHRPGYLSCVV